MKSYAFIALIVALLFANTNGYADSAIPSHIKEKMNSVVGTWEWQQETKETQTSDPVKSTGTWSARWIFDNLIEWRTTYSSSEGSGTAIEYEGYDPMMQGYSYYFASSGTRGRTFDGHWDGNTFYMQQIGTDTNGVSWRGRCVFPYNNDFTEIVNYQCEALENGKWWVWREGNAKKAD